MPTVLATVCYVARLSSIIPRDAICLPSTLHRLFLSSLILSCKFHNEAAPSFRQWVDYSGDYFTLQDLVAMEKEMMNLLDYNLLIKSTEFFSVLNPLLEPISQDLKHIILQKQKVKNVLQITYKPHRRTYRISDKNIGPPGCFSQSALQSLLLILEIC
ncbi:cyclin family protein NDAI_0G04080 [Naumovozyma dairenensis CBS 421]|uniref:Cyclin N-terminal domain-containing protein n=1 Tax=Naumovozyma dairenensis (strain ATCC 10597 / BCRC 20456 / CBS 421 / NBRC 0211 / NRRL Y-12639) TaxID=1071378 RepID=J7SAY2_NAUDC|nr:hypothetical protein NDAI_0G04080 [Naumovozyma dairenensis CBS 421]CCK73393.1 hypothetical protein NDAI_0G04080 [Naumovozyma dairenensis CBS 421]